GLLKMDFLGIRNLSILGHAVEIVEKTTGKRIDLYNLAPWEDKKTYDMLTRGETIGVFQLSGSGMTRYLKELKPTSIFDIMAMVALFRPGPMESIPEYIRRKNHPELIEYLDARMKEYLDQSLGLIVYQDDVLLTAIHLAGYNWEEADKFRKAMGKKIPEEMMKQKETFFKGCKEYGKVPEVKIHRLWELIEPFAAYGFNKAHAASYAVIAYQTAYMKANFPVQYMTAVLIAESGDIDKVPPIIHECGRMNIKVLPPDVNHSFKNFAMITSETTPPIPSLKGGAEPIAASPFKERLGEVSQDGAHIRFGLNGIKNLGEHIAEVIYRERKERGEYKNLEDFLSRVHDKDLNKKSLESLIKCGALDSFGYDRGELMGNSDNLLSFVKGMQEKTTTKQHSLFSGSAIDVVSKVRLAPAPAATLEDTLVWEKELLGLYVTAHPFSYFQKTMGKALTPISELDAHGRSQWVVVGGVIDSTKKKITRSGQAMMFVSIQDTTDTLELLVFPRTYESTKDVWVEGKTVCVVGKTSEEEGDDKLFVERAYELTKENVAALLQQLSVNSGSTSIRSYVAPQVMETLAEENGVTIELSAEQVKKYSEDIKKILSKYSGEKTVFLKVGDKKIKTQFKIKEGVEFYDELNSLLESAGTN
ncbi:MAG TPA: DNA polymerase III subunit alpha, partial [Patescibacteria group bacterium]|nr:DNA polymerase III subunit alpha [Patescibacteria group bacterium]